MTLFIRYNCDNPQFRPVFAGFLFRRDPAFLNSMSVDRANGREFHLTTFFHGVCFDVRSVPADPVPFLPVRQISLGEIKMPFHPGILFSAFVLILCLGINVASYPEVNALSRQGKEESTTEENPSLFAPGFDLDETSIRPPKTSNVNRPIPLAQKEADKENASSNEILMPHPALPPRNTEKTEKHVAEKPAVERSTVEKPVVEKSVKASEPLTKNSDQTVEKTADSEEKKTESPQEQRNVPPAAEAKPRQDETVAKPSPKDSPPPVVVKSEPEPKTDPRTAVKEEADEQKTEPKKTEPEKTMEKFSEPSEKPRDSFSAFSPIVPPSMQLPSEESRSNVFPSSPKPLPDPSIPTPETATPIAPYATETRIDSKIDSKTDPEKENAALPYQAPPSATEIFQSALDRPLMSRPTQKVIPLPPSADSLPAARPLPPLAPLEK